MDLPNQLNMARIKAKRNRPVKPKKPYTRYQVEP